MSGDVVERLRETCAGGPECKCTLNEAASIITSQAAEIEASKHDIARYVEANTALMAERASLIETKREQIGALTKERDEAISKWEGADGMGGAVVHAIRELLNFHNVPISAFIDDHVANAIRQGNDAKRLLAETRAALEWSARLFDGIRGAVETNQVVDKDVHGTAISGRDAARAAARTLTNGGENGR